MSFEKKYHINLRTTENDYIVLGSLELSDYITLEQSRKVIRKSFDNIPDFAFIYKNIRLKRNQEISLKISRVAEENVIAIDISYDTDVKLFVLELDHCSKKEKCFLSSKMKLTELSDFIEKKLLLTNLSFSKKGVVLSKKQELVYPIESVAEWKNNVFTISVNGGDQIQKADQTVELSLQQSVEVIEIPDDEEIELKGSDNLSSIKTFSEDVFNNFIIHNKAFLEKKERTTNTTVVYGIIDCAWTIMKTKLLLNEVKKSPPSASVLKWVDKMTASNIDLQKRCQQLKVKRDSSNTKDMEEEISKTLTSLKLSQNNIEKALGNNQIIPHEQEERNDKENEEEKDEFSVEDEEIESIVSQIKADFNIEPNQ